MSKPGFYKEDGTKITLADLAKLPANAHISLHEHPCQKSPFRHALDRARLNHGDFRIGRNNLGLFKGVLVGSETVAANQHQGHEDDANWNGRSALRHIITFTGIEPFKSIDGRGAPKGPRANGVDHSSSPAWLSKKPHSR